MANQSKYRLAIMILYSGEKGLEEAITIFNAWCHKKLTGKQTKIPPTKDKNPLKNRYGFQKTSNFSGELYFVSPTRFNHRQLISLVRDMERNNQVSVLTSKCPKIIVPPKPAS
jgi:hypothetical protein